MIDAEDLKDILEELDEQIENALEEEKDGVLYKNPRKVAQFDKLLEKVKQVASQTYGADVGSDNDPDTETATVSLVLASPTVITDRTNMYRSFADLFDLADGVAILDRNDKITIKYLINNYWIRA